MMGHDNWMKLVDMIGIRDINAGGIDIYPLRIKKINWGVDFAIQN